MFFNLAKKHNVKFKILACEVPLEELQQRITKRQEENCDASDADLNVLDYQLQHSDVICEDEMPYIINIPQGARESIPELLREM